MKHETMKRFALPHGGGYDDKIYFEGMKKIRFLGLDMNKF